MARVAIFVMIPVVALLAWRDVVVERQLGAVNAGLATASDIDRHLVARDAERDDDRRMLARDAELNEALWSLLLRQPEAAIAQVGASERMPARVALPESAHTIADVARCMLAKSHAALPAGESRLARVCALQHAVSAR